MSSKRDLVEAHSFNRRRLVTAFLSGAPGGREVEPVRYGRTLIGGAVLAGMILAGAAVLGFMKPTVSNNWDKQGVVVDKDNGSRFLASNGRLYPVLNTASARLLVPGSKKINLVPDKLIAKRPHGPAYGIQAAPDVLPARNMLANTGWTACTNKDGMINLGIHQRPLARPASGRAVVVQDAKGNKYLIAGGRRYPLDRTTAATLLQDIGVSQQAITVPGPWLNLFQPGSTMSPLPMPQQGEVARVGNTYPSEGSPVQLPGGQHYVLVGGKGKPTQLRPLSPFAFRLYKAEVGNLPVLHHLPAAPPHGKSFAPADWPQQPVTSLGGGNPCALLHTKAGSAPSVTLAAPTSTQAQAPSGPSATSAGNKVLIQVQPGSGAVVRSFDGVPGKGLEYLIDSQGRRYALNQDGSSPNIVSDLGYGDLTPPPVPGPWLALFTGPADGPALSFNAADHTVM